jgi:1-acyl-sn-glycerol-3-phosphate acyltransferase
MSRFVLVRSLLYETVLIGSAVVFSTLLIGFGAIVSDQGKDRIGRTWARLNLRALRAMCGLGYRVTGLEHLPEGAAVVLCKHQSSWEIIALRAILPLRQSWVLKQELMRIPIFGQGLKQLHPIPIDRSAGRRAFIAMVRAGIKELDSGRSVIVFPEGTRVAPGVRKAYAPGGAALAQRSGRPLVPIAHNAGLFWRRRAMRKLPGNIDVVIGPIIATEGRAVDEINAEVEAWIESTVASLPGFERAVPVS